MNTFACVVTVVMDGGWAQRVGGGEKKGEKGRNSRYFLLLLVCVKVDVMYRRPSDISKRYVTFRDAMIL